jgi:hypothetical protein
MPLPRDGANRLRTTVDTGEWDLCFLGVDRPHSPHQEHRGLHLVGTWPMLQTGAIETNSAATSTPAAAPRTHNASSPSLVYVHFVHTKGALDVE